MKRSNRLILLIGIFLAAAAFVGIVLLLGQGVPANGVGQEVARSTIVVASTDIALGTTLTEDLVEEQAVDLAAKPPGSPTLESEVIGQTVTTQLTRGQIITAQAWAVTTVDPNIGRLLEPGHRAMSIELAYGDVVGRLIRPGDRVDVVVSITGADRFPVVTTDPATDQITVVPGVNATSVKAIIQNVEVVGTLLPAVPTPEGQPAPVGPSFPGPETSQLVILAVTAQEAEVLRFAQIDGGITLILRSPEDAEAPDEVTTGITLRQLVDAWGVIPPQIVETILPND